MDDLAKRLNGRRVIASISGGKDSGAMSLWLTEQGIEHDRVSGADAGCMRWGLCDTGAETKEER